MLRTLLLYAALCVFVLLGHAQNTSPYWSLAGNSNSTTSSKLGNTKNIPLRLLTNNSTRMYIAGSGNIGIGTTSPTYKGHIEAGASGAALYANTTGSYGVYSFGGSYGIYAKSTNGFGGIAISTSSDGFDAYTTDGY